MVFKPKLSSVAYIVLGVFSVGLLIVPFIVQGLSTFKVIFALLALITAFFTVIYSAMRYEFKETQLRLSCGPFFSKIIYKEITEVTLINLEDYKYFRLIGISSPGFYFGIFTSIEGRATVYATSTKEVILIKTSSKRYVVSPKDKEGFIAMVKGKAV